MGVRLQVRFAGSFCISVPSVEPFGPDMQMLSIEYLSLAAETTVVLLLLAFAWPKKKSELVQATVTGEALTWEPAKLHYLQSCVHRGLYLQQWQENHNNTASTSIAAEPYVMREFDGDTNCPSLPLPWQDRLTRLPNRHGFDAVLNAWLSVESKHRSESCVAMVTLNKYSELVSTHGAMVTEHALQGIATHLSVSASGEALVARYLPDRFVVLRFASQLPACHRTMEIVLDGISDNGFFKVGGEPVSLSCNISIVRLENDSDLVSTMDMLEEGAIESDKSGRRIISRLEGVWTAEPTSVKQNCPTEEEDKTPESVASQLGEALEESVHHVPPTTPSDTTDKELDKDVEDLSQSNDISAVADANDIAALLEQIDSNKSNIMSAAEQLNEAAST